MIDTARICSGALALAYPLVALTLAGALHASPQVWIDELTSARGSGLYAIDADGAGGCYVAGGIIAASAGGDALLQRRDANGQVIWSRQLDSTAPDHGRGVAADGTGGVFLVGSTEGALGGVPQGSLDAFVARYDGGGDLDWVVQLGSAAYDIAAVAVADGAGGVFVSGTTQGSLAGPAEGFNDVWVARFDASGAQSWVLQFGSTTMDEVLSAASDGQGGVFLSGAAGGSLTGTSSGHVWCARFGGAGNQLFLRQYDTPKMLAGGVVTSDGIGGAFLASSFEFPAAGGAQSDVVLFHLDGAGNTLWTRTLDVEELDHVLGIAPDGSGGAWICGTVSDFDLPFPWGDAFVLQADDQGVERSELKLAGPGLDVTSDVLALGPSEVIAVGSTEFGIIEPDFTYKHDGWIARFGSCDFESPTNYCVAAPNSTGVGAVIDDEGTRYLANDDFGLSVRGCPAGELGLFLMSQSQAATPFGDGVLCLGGSVLRLLPPVVLDASGTGTLALDFADPSSSAAQISAGSTWNFQFWYRDTASAGAGFNLSDGLSATFCP